MYVKFLTLKEIRNSTNSTNFRTERFYVNRNENFAHDSITSGI